MEDIVPRCVNYRTLPDAAFLLGLYFTPPNPGRDVIHVRSRPITP